jgi:hypothetical protein
MGLIHGEAVSTFSFVPKLEISVRELFAQEAASLGYRIVESRASFPDYVLERSGKRLFAEAEFRSSDFLRHHHDFARCDLLVVWEHDLPYLPVPVLELRSLSVHGGRRRRTISPGPLSGPTFQSPEKRSGSRRRRRRLRR